MGEKTGIAYVHHTRNFWSGCTKISPGCDNCYAEAFNRWTRGKNLQTGEAKNWGPGVPRIPHLAGAARDIRKWDREAEAAGERRRVFINTNSDTFDNEAPDEWRTALYESIRESDWLDFLLVTKRVGNVAKMVPSSWMQASFPSNIRLLITICNQEEAYRDLPKLLALRCKNGISYEPALGPVNWEPWLTPCGVVSPDPHGRDRAIEWVIIGGESGPKARLFNAEWARSTIAQCKAAGVPVFMKQVGPALFEAKPDPSDSEMALVRSRLMRNRAGADPAEWDKDLRVREWPE